MHSARTMHPWDSLMQGASSSVAPAGAAVPSLPGHRATQQTLGQNHLNWRSSVRKRRLLPLPQWKVVGQALPAGPDLTPG